MRDSFKLVRENYFSKLGPLNGILTFTYKPTHIDPLGKSLQKLNSSVMKFIFGQVFELFRDSKAKHFV